MRNHGEAEALHVRLARLEQVGSLSPRAIVHWPEVSESAALYLAIALLRARDEIPGPASILTRLSELGWLRSARLNVDLAHGIGWISPKSVGVSHADVPQFVESVLSAHLNGAGNGHG